MYEQIEIEIKVLRDNGNKKPLREMSFVIMVIDLENRLLNISQQRWVYLGLAENCNSHCATITATCKFFQSEGKSMLLRRRKTKKVWKSCDKESETFHWLNFC